jgi:hypothetical protein
VLNYIFEFNILKFEDFNSQIINIKRPFFITKITKTNTFHNLSKYYYLFINISQLIQMELTVAKTFKLTKKLGQGAFG